MSTMERLTRKKYVGRWRRASSPIRRVMSPWPSRVSRWAAPNRTEGPACVCLSLERPMRTHSLPQVGLSLLVEQVGQAEGEEQRQGGASKGLTSGVRE